ncbi:hypothetical protein GOP47_0003975 [Adiantum capillus-veneris]|uniref:Uncharacterized protein n=1 Tax=Adiantum capillus-veneris TaxID=13818 RepID=A0A9D4V7A1_ADICA|nr:hypothetical protein GOP47_0003975 [Adiantum capillus-veneris]
MSSKPTAAAMAESLRSRTWRCLRSSHHLRTSQKLALLRRFLHSFSRLGDVESQLVLRYEILCLRESCGSTEMKVDTSEWSSFAEDCLSAGFPGNASKAFEKAISQTEGYQTTNVDPQYEVQSCLKHVQHIMMPEINGRFDKGSSNGSFSDSLREKCCMKKTIFASTKCSGQFLRASSMLCTISLNGLVLNFSTARMAFYCGFFCI